MLKDQGEIDYTKLSEALFKEYNKLRKNPKSYVEKLTKAENYYKDKIFRYPNEIPIETYEGVSALKEAIEFLKTQEPVKELQYSNELTKSAFDHAKDIGSQGSYNHEGSDGSLLSDRIEKYIEWDGSIAESLQFCYKNPENILLSLIIDDGSKEKHQRGNLFSEEFEYVGIGCAKHKTFKICSVFDYAKNLYPKGQEPPEKIEYDPNYLKNKKEDNKELNPFQLDDPYAPDNTIDVKIVKIKKNFGDGEHNITRKIFSLNDGKKHIIDYEEKDAGENL
jgi:uncharacterized protein YkwD